MSTSATVYVKFYAQVVMDFTLAAHLKEAFFICKLQPSINSRAELTELIELLF